MWSFGVHGALYIVRQRSALLGYQILYCHNTAPLFGELCGAESNLNRLAGMPGPINYIKLDLGRFS